jgi:hypothetical protein
MANVNKAMLVTIQETSGLKPHANGRTGEAVDSEGADYARRVCAEDFGGTGDVSEVVNRTRQ